MRVALAGLLLTVLAAAAVTPAQAESEPALLASVENLRELVRHVRHDVHVHTPSDSAATPAMGSGTRDEQTGRIVRETTQRRLTQHLINLNGHPHFDPIWTHYILEARAATTASRRNYHVRSCPICNVAFRELAFGTPAALPALEIPFSTVQLGDGYFKVDPSSGRIFRIVDPIKGTPSFVSTGRLVMAGGRWWVDNGSQRSGPIRTRGGSRPPWEIHSEARAAAAEAGKSSPRVEAPKASVPAAPALPALPAAPATASGNRAGRPGASPAARGRSAPTALEALTARTLSPREGIEAAPSGRTEEQAGQSAKPAKTVKPAKSAKPAQSAKSEPSAPTADTKQSAGAVSAMPDRQAILMRRPQSSGRAIPASELRPDTADAAGETSDADSAGGDYKPFWK